ncbi:hypothetical protein MPHO_19020 [Mycolicibacterium phocaicum]|nr:hypothetical protein MPHO_19020 [Mycolicibacterium phocaicum]
MREVQRAARPGDGDIGHQVQTGCTGRCDERQEDIVRAFEGEHAVGAETGQFAGVVGRPLRRSVDLQLYAHGR